MKQMKKRHFKILQKIGTAINVFEDCNVLSSRNPKFE